MVNDEIKKNIAKTGKRIFIHKQNEKDLPSQSMQFSNISPAPNSCTAFASSYAPIGRPSLPPLTLQKERHVKKDRINMKSINLIMYI